MGRPGDRGWWQAADGRWYPPDWRPAPPRPAMVALPPSAPGRVSARRLHRAVLALAAAVLVLTAVVAVDLVRSDHGVVSEGTAVVVPGQRTNVLPQPDFLSVCSVSQYDDSPACDAAAVAAIDHARSLEHLAPMVLPSNWTSLTPAQQLFVATNLERTVRGLAPLAGMAQSLDDLATAAARVGEDPQLAAGPEWTTVGANWTQGYSSPLAVVYEWVYDDGLGSSNIDCTRQHLAQCWAHRANVLLDLPCTTCVLGAAYVPADAAGDPLSFAEVLAETPDPPVLDFTWNEEQPYLD